MKAMRLVVILAAGALSAAVADEGRVEVLADRVNLRAKPRPEAEVSGQVGPGTILEYRGTNESWVGVTPPTNVSLWIKAEFVKNNKSMDRVNIRSGAGINYPSVGILPRDQGVEPRGQLGEWLAIAPPSNAVLWVSRELVKVTLVEPAASGPEVSGSAGSEAAVPAGDSKPGYIPPYVPSYVPPAVPSYVATSPAPEVAGAPTTPPPDLKDRELVPLQGQGEPMEFTGALHKTSFFDFGRISNYCLTDWDRGRPVTLCYIRGNNAQLKGFEGRRLRIKGDGYWIKGQAKPVVVPKEITPLKPAPAHE